jgi:hypothetical protein
MPAVNIHPGSSAQCAGLSTTCTGDNRTAMALTHRAAGTTTEVNHLRITYGSRNTTDLVGESEVHD